MEDNQLADFNWQIIVTIEIKYPNFISPPLQTFLAKGQSIYFIWVTKRFAYWRKIQVVYKFALSFTQAITQTQNAQQ